MYRYTMRADNGDVYVKDTAHLSEDELISFLGDKLANYEDAIAKIEKKVEQIKSATDYPHNFKGQMVDDLEWVLSALSKTES